MSLVNPCNLSLAAVNTGVDCDSAMLAPAKLFMVPANDRFTLADIVSAGSFTAYALTRCHDIPSKRWFPLFGSYAPINDVKNTNEADVQETMPDGSMALVRRGNISRVFVTTKGGLCFAQVLMSMRKNYSFIEADQDSPTKVLLRDFGTTGLGGVPSILSYGQSPDLADTTKVFKNNFFIGCKPYDYIQNSKIMSSTAGEDILNVNGLLDVDVTVGAQTQTTGFLFVKVISECSETDFATQYPGTGAGTIGQVTNFVVTKVSDGTTPATTAVTVVGGEIRIAGTFASAASYKVALAIPSVLKTNGLPGYEGVTTATVPVP